MIIMYYDERKIFKKPEIIGRDKKGDIVYCLCYELYLFEYYNKQAFI